MGRFPNIRMRRLRRSAEIRALVEEHRLTVTDLICPLFIHAGKENRQKIEAMPNVYRHSLTDLLRVCENISELGIRAVALFPAIDNSHKGNNGKEAYNPDGLVPCAIRQIKQRFPKLLIISDVALDPYTSHGQDGLIDDDGYVLNDATVAVLQRQALCHAQAGAEIVAPSDMMDGRIGAIRSTLEDNGFAETIIVSYAVKYASSFYNPFREAVQSKTLLKGDKKSYQMSPANRNEALREAQLDIAEGADVLLVKPAGLYLDIIAGLRRSCPLPLFAYQVSGEYVMLKMASKYLAERDCVLESLLAIKRAGAEAIFSYYALDVARWLTE